MYLCGLVFILLVTFDIAFSDLAWHLFKDDHQNTRHSLYNSSYASFIRERWNSTSTSRLDSVSYAELEFDRAIEIIYSHQHPADCSKANFLISSGAYSDFGSEFHEEGYGLSIALAMNRVYVPAMHYNKSSSQIWKTPPAICGDVNNTIACYYEPWTSCSWTVISALIEKQSRVEVLTDASPQLSGDVVKDHPDRVVSIDLAQYSKSLFQKVPDEMVPLLDWNRIPPKLAYYWWRAVSTAYLSVPNKRSRSIILRHKIPHLGEVNGKCVSVFLPDVEDFNNFTMLTHAIDAAWDLSFGHERIFRKVVVVASKTPQPLNAMLEWADKHSWKVAFNSIHHYLFKALGLIITHLPALRKHLKRFESAKNYKEDESMEAFHQHLPLEYAFNLISLTDLMKCDAFVCALSSSFCRVLDGLRATVAGKPEAEFADVGPDTCSRPPCLHKNRAFRSFMW